jgi:hypothetical protein
LRSSTVGVLRSAIADFLSINDVCWMDLSV